MDLNCPTNEDSGNDADPPDLTISSYSTQQSYEINKECNDSITRYYVETRVIEVNSPNVHENSSGDELSDFILGLDLSSPRKLESIISKESNAENITELNIYSSREYK